MGSVLFIICAWIAMVILALIGADLQIAEGLLALGAGIVALIATSIFLSWTDDNLPLMILRWRLRHLEMRRELLFARAIAFGALSAYEVRRLNLYNTRIDTLKNRGS